MLPRDGPLHHLVFTWTPRALFPRFLLQCTVFPNYSVPECVVLSSYERAGGGREVQDFALVSNVAPRVKMWGSLHSVGF